MSKSVLLIPLLIALAACGSTGPSPSTATDSACGPGREATQACQIERYMKAN